MQVGDFIGVRGPKGAFTYTPNMVREIGMVAGINQMNFNVKKKSPNIYVI